MKKVINWFLSEIVMIEQYYNLIGPEAHLARPNKKR